MALCTQCGTLLHDDDARNHICNPLDIVEKGKPIRKGEKKQVV